MEKISERIIMLRKVFKLSREDFFLNIGISRSALSHLESDRSYPSYEIVKKMSDYFNISTDYFYDKGDIDLDDYIRGEKQVIFDYNSEDFKQKQISYEKIAKKLKKDLLKDSSFSSDDRNVLDILWELRNNIEDLKNFSDSVIDLYEPDTYSAFLKYLADKSSLLTIEQYKNRSRNTINKFASFEVDLALLCGKIEDFLAKMKILEK